MPTYEKKELSGVIEGVNADGVKLGGEWFNKGKFYKGPELSKGQRVVMEVSGKYINNATVLPGSAPSSGSTGAGGSSASSSGGNYNPDSQRLSIHRQVALKEAINIQIAATKAATLADLETALATAARIETWLNRPFGAAAATVTATSEDSDDE